MKQWTPLQQICDKCWQRYFELLFKIKETILVFNAKIGAKNLVRLRWSSYCNWFEQKMNFSFSPFVSCLCSTFSAIIRNDIECMALFANLFDIFTTVLDQWITVSLDCSHMIRRTFTLTFYCSLVSLETQMHNIFSKLLMHFVLYWN